MNKNNYISRCISNPASSHLNSNYLPGEGGCIFKTSFLKKEALNRICAIFAKINFKCYD